MDLSVLSSCSQVYFSTNAKKVPFLNLHFPEMVLVKKSLKKIYTYNLSL